MKPFLYPNQLSTIHLRYLFLLLIAVAIIWSGIKITEFYSNAEIKSVPLHTSMYQPGEAAGMVIKKIEQELFNLTSNEYSNYSTEVLKVMIPGREEIEFCSAILGKLKNKNYTETYLGNGLWLVDIDKEFLPPNLKRHAPAIQWHIFEQSGIIHNISGHLLTNC
jgi:hypothetical protein